MLIRGPKSYHESGRLLVGLSRSSGLSLERMSEGTTFLIGID